MSESGTFSYHTLSMEDMIVQLQRLKIREIEMSRGEFMLMKPPSAAMCQAARDKFDRAGIRCVSYYTATIKNDADLDLAVSSRRFLERTMCRAMRPARFCSRIDRRFTAEGLTFGIHNHWFKQKFAYETVDDVLRGLNGLVGERWAQLWMSGRWRHAARILWMRSGGWRRV